MERKNTLLLTVIAIATLLVAVVGATFAYFATQLSQESNGLNVTTTTEAATAVFLASGQDLTLLVEGSNMQRGQTDTQNAVLSNSNNTVLNVVYGASSAGNALSCTYDIVFKFDSGADQYLYSAATTKPTEGWLPFGKEFTLKVGTATVTGWTDSGTQITSSTGMNERNIAYDGTCKNGNETVTGVTSYETCVATEGNTWEEGSQMTLVSGATIYTNTVITPAHCSVEGYTNETDCTTTGGGTWTPATGGTTVSWPIEVAFYNLPLDQSALAGKSFAGRVEVANVVC